MRKLLTIMVLALGCLGATQESRAQSCPGVTPWVFDDVLASDTFCSYITWMAEEGVTLGCGIIDANRRLYCPNDGVTRKQMAAFMFRLGEALFPATCAAGQVLKWNGVQWACANDNTGGGGTVTSVAAGTGLQGSPNPITGVGSLNLAPSYQLPQACANGQVPKSNGSGGWVCGNDTSGAGTVTNVATGAGLTGGPITGSGTVDLRLNAGGGLSKSLGAGSNELGVADGGITNAKIATGTITADRLAPNQQLPNCLVGQVVRRSVSGWVCSNLPPAINVVVPAPFGSREVSITIGADGFPAFSYYDPTSLALRMVKCSDAACARTQTYSFLDSVGNPGRYNAIAVGADGLPVISYLAETGGDLRVAKCSDAVCNLAVTVTTVDSAGNVGVDTAIAIGADGLPVISYTDFSNGANKLKVVKCGNAACNNSNVITTIESGTDGLGYDSSIAIGTDGFPVISYTEYFPNRRLKVAKCANAACSGAAGISIVDANVNSIFKDTSIGIGADSLPVISYRDEQGNMLKVAKCSNAACSGASTITSIANTLNGGAFNSLKVPADGLPVISFFDQLSGLLKVAKCGSAMCTNAVSVSVADPSQYVGFGTSLAVGADGLPIVVYYDYGNARIKTLKCSNAACLEP